MREPAARGGAPRLRPGGRREVAVGQGPLRAPPRRGPQSTWMAARGARLGKPMGSLPAGPEPASQRPAPVACRAAAPHDPLAPRHPRSPHVPASPAPAPATRPGAARHGPRSPLRAPPLDPPVPAAPAPAPAYARAPPSHPTAWPAPCARPRWPASGSGAASSRSTATPPPTTPAPGPHPSPKGGGAGQPTDGRPRWLGRIRVAPGGRARPPGRRTGSRAAARPRPCRPAGGRRRRPAPDG